MKELEKLTVDEPTQQGVSRRDFLKISGAAGVVLSLTQMGGIVSNSFVNEVFAATREIEYASWEDIYRKEWKWDKVNWGSHTNICWPQGGCSFRVYSKNGIVWREEQTANTPASNSKYPDYNPLGCQKGCSFSNNLYGEDRVKYPLKRVGERGEGKWERVSWDEATEDIADAILDSFESQGPDGFVLDAPHVHAGSAAWAGGFRLCQLLSGVSPDINLDVGDTYMGTMQTMGKQHFGFSADNLLDAELIFMTHSNWSYTYPTGYHFLTEARYKGAEVVIVAPDFNPSTPSCDIHVPVKVGSDAAFWLGLCHVMVSENLVDKSFVREQTDLPLLVRDDTGRYLRASEVDGGREDQLFYYDIKAKAISKAPRGSLKLVGEPALEGIYTATLANGDKVKVKPVYELVKSQLKDYSPEDVYKKSNVPASLVEELGRKLAKKRTCSYIGFTCAKSYHGDLMERSFLLAMALSGNWGKPGTGFSAWAYPEDAMEFLSLTEKPASMGGLEPFAQMKEEIAAKMKESDPDVIEELIDVEVTKKITTLLGIVPPVFWNYYHGGYDKLYNNKSWGDPALKKSFGEYMQEAIDKGWWTRDHIRPAPDKTPQVLMLISHNPMRRKRSGAKLLPEVLFPKLKMIFVVETRMSASAMYADIVLPSAWYYEKIDMTTPCSGNPFFAYIDQSVQPPGECKPEWETMALLMKKIGERAKARKMFEFSDHFGKKRRYDELYNKFTMDGKLMNHEDVISEMVDINAATGIFPKGYDYKQFKKDGQQRIHGMGVGYTRASVANEYDKDKPFYSLRWHLDNKTPYPTYARRAQFYIDHEWYLEAGERLPTHKDTPMIGGDYPFKITGGHPRHSIHTTHQTNAPLMRLHRAQPVMHMNDKDAAELGLEDGEQVEVFNDVSDFEIMLRVSPSVGPKQVIVYFWDAHLYKNWKPYDILLVGYPKALQFAGGYEQLRYYFMEGSPAPVTDRGVRVGVRKKIKRLEGEDV